MNTFFIIDELSQQQQGPFSPTELQSRNITVTTMVWATGMADWSPAGDIEELKFIFDASLATPKPPTMASPGTVYPANPQSYNAMAPASGSRYGSNVYGGNNVNRGGSLDDLRVCPKTWLIESVLMTALCCLPLGVAALLYSSKVQSSFNAGDYEGAEKSSKYAKNILTVALVSTLGIGAIYIIMMVFFGVFSTF